MSQAAAFNPLFYNPSVFFKPPETQNFEGVFHTHTGDVIFLKKSCFSVVFLPHFLKDGRTLIDRFFLIILLLFQRV